MMVVICSFLGLVIDVGNLRYSRRSLQLAVDAAAVSAGLEVHQCSNALGCPAMIDAARSSLVENGYTSIAVGSNCVAPATKADITLIVNTPPCALGAADPNTGSKSFVELQVTRNVPTYFAKIMGINSVLIGARAEAARPIAPPCIWALDKTGAGAISVLAGLGINSQCGIVDESSSSAAFSCLIGFAVSAPSIALHGGAAGLLCPVTHKIQTGAAIPQPADPLAYLPKPSVGSCGSKSQGQYYGSPNAVNILLGGTYVFNPGVYCGGISITAALATNVTFNPGTYILTDGPGLLGITQGGLTITLTALSNVQATGVTFYNTGTIGSIAITAPAALSLSNFNMTAPTSGTYGGVLFFQDPVDTATGVFLVSLAQGNKLDGAIYLPSASVSYGVGAISSDYTILVAKDINFNVAVLSTFGNDYSTLSNGSPLDANLAFLMQ